MPARAAAYVRVAGGDYAAVRSGFVDRGDRERLASRRRLALEERRSARADRTGRYADMDTTVGAGTREELSRDPYSVYRRVGGGGARVGLGAANRYVVPRWEDVVGLDELPGITAREEPSLMTRAMGRTMLRTDGA